jgi:hypothetical protein
MRLLRLCGMLLSLIALPLPTPAASVRFSADDTAAFAGDPNPAYALIRSVMGKGAVTTPDCTHPGFGPHIALDNDADLGKVFQFHLHVAPDGDACFVTNHPRNEIKVDTSSPEYFKIRRYETATYRWQFRLPPGFQSSYNFTYIRQVKAVDGDTLIPLISFNLQKGRNGAPDTLQINHADSNGVRTTLRKVDVTPYLGEWIEAYESMTADTHGRYALTLTRVRDGAELLSYSSNDIDMWRFSGTTFIRPKWGIYRSVDNPQYLRDEQVAYRGFCLAKGSDDCPPTPTATVAAPTFSPAPGSYDSEQSVTLASATDGANIRYSTNGSTPDCSSTLYETPLTVTASTTIRAVACKSGMSASAVSGGSYAIGSAPVKLDLAGSAATASASADSNHLPAASLDSNPGTFWAAQGNNQWLRYDLQSPRTVTHLNIAWARGNQGRASFELQTSDNGNDFVTVFSGQSSGATTAPETYDIPDTSARYIRLLGHGNSVNSWNLVAETEIYALP